MILSTESFSSAEVNYCESFYMKVPIYKPSQICYNIDKKEKSTEALNVFFL